MERVLVFRLFECFRRAFDVGTEHCSTFPAKMQSKVLISIVYTSIVSPSHFKEYWRRDATGDTHRIARTNDRVWTTAQGLDYVKGNAFIVSLPQPAGILEGRGAAAGSGGCGGCGGHERIESSDCAIPEGAQNV